MENTKTFRMPNMLTTFVMSLILMAFVPFSAFASTSTIAPFGNIESSSLITKLSKPKITGTATGTKTIRITLHKEGKTSIFYKSSTIRVKNGVWSTKISKKLPNGTYTIELFGSKGINSTVLNTDKLVVNTNKKTTSNSASTFVVSPIPLLTGGLARTSSSVPISYLQITNIGKESSILSGFWVKQNGSASTKSVTGFSTVDDKGGSRSSTEGNGSSTLFKNGLAFVPTNVTFAPGEMKLFTIKAIISNDISIDLGKQLKIDVSAIESNASVKGNFPILGTTWMIAR